MCGLELSTQNVPSRKFFRLFDGDFGALDGLAGEKFDAALAVFHDAVFGGVNGVIAAHAGAFAGTLGQTDLADNYLAGFNFFTTK